MAGSLKGFRYVSDDLVGWAVFLDESNIEAVNTQAGIAITPAEKYKIPSNLKPRKATFQSADGLIRRDIVVLNAARFGELSAATTIVDQTSGETLFLKRLKGEELTLVSLSDTGLLDGDAD